MSICYDCRDAGFQFPRECEICRYNEAKMETTSKDIEIALLKGHIVLLVEAHDKMVSYFKKNSNRLGVAAEAARKDPTDEGHKRMNELYTVLHDNNKSWSLMQDLFWKALREAKDE